MKKVFLLALMALGLLVIPFAQPEPRFNCVFPEEPNNIVRSEGGSIVLVAFNWGSQQSAVEEAIREVVLQLQKSSFLSWPPARGGGTIPVYPATSQLIACWEKEYPGKKTYGSFRSNSGPYGPGIYLRADLGPSLQKVILAHEAIHAFWTGDELLARIATVPFVFSYVRGGSP